MSCLVCGGLVALGACSGAETRGAVPLEPGADMAPSPAAPGRPGTQISPQGMPVDGTGGSSTFGNPSVPVTLQIGGFGGDDGGGGMAGSIGFDNPVPLSGGFGGTLGQSSAEVVGASGFGAEGGFGGSY